MRSSTTKLQSNFHSGVWAVLVLCGLVAIAYWNSFYGTFVYDDVRMLKTFSGGIFPYSRLNDLIPGRPFFIATMALNYKLGGPNAFGFHAVNLFIHLAAALVLFDLCRRTFALQEVKRHLAAPGDWLALAVAAVWAVHPLHTSAVTYIFERSESMSGLFALITLWAFIRAAGSARPGPWKIASALACFIALGSKQSVAAIPLLVLLYDWLFLHRTKTFRQIIEKNRHYYIALALAWVFLAYLVLSSPELPTEGFHSRVLPEEYLLTEASVIVRYLELALWPHPLSIDHYDWPMTFDPINALPYCVIVLGMVFLVIWGLRQRRAWSFSGVWFFLILAPTSTVFPLEGEPIAEWRMYLPLAAIIVLIVVGVDRVGSKIIAAKPRIKQKLGTVALAGLALIISALTVVTIHRNNDYRSAIELYTAETHARPRNPRAWKNLGLAFAGNMQFDDAMAAVDKSIEVGPGFGWGHVLKGDILAKRKNFKAAAVEYQKGLECHLLPSDRNVRRALEEVQKKLQNDTGSYSR